MGSSQSGFENKICKNVVWSTEIMKLLKKQVWGRHLYVYVCVWDYHISLESLNPNTLNTRLNKSSLRETLHYYYLFEQLYYLLAISALSITITYTLLLSIARTSKQE